ncbi:MAG: hypothetical protein AB4368_12300, partial [Xenococcaceae cyanobacterium]
QEFFRQGGQIAPIFNTQILTNKQKRGAICPRLSYFVIFFCNPTRTSGGAPVLVDVPLRLTATRASTASLADYKFRRGGRGVFNSFKSNFLPRFI